MNIAIAQSGGPTAAINASLIGVVKEALSNKTVDKIYGSLNGINGLINENLIDLKKSVKTEEELELIKTTPATVLGSCRYKLPSLKENSDVYKKIFKCLTKNNIQAFFYIGGNDSMDTVDKLSKYTAIHNIDIKIIGIPKTIDNDLCYTDHTPGFGSAAKYVATTLQEITRDSSVYALKSVTIVEIMGRNAGWLTASTCVLHTNGETAPHLIYLPESKFSLEKFIDDVKKQLEIRDSVIVAVSEGITLSETDNFRSGKVDIFGHAYLSGIGKLLENTVTEKINCKVRSIELNVMQRCSSHILSQTDITESEKIGKQGFLAALSGQTGKMMTFERISNNPYKIKIGSVEAAKTANAEKTFPKEWITPDETNVTTEAENYFLPLINGEIKIKTKNGLPVHFKLQ